MVGAGPAAPAGRARTRQPDRVGPVAEVCPPPAGWRLATAAELVAAGFKVFMARHPRQNYYCGQAGWDGVEWEGVERFWFVTADWAAVKPIHGGAVRADEGEGDLPSHGWTAAELRGTLPNGHFAGVVCVRASD